MGEDLIGSLSIVSGECKQVSGDMALLHSADEMERR
jgi:hypothetical protein